MERFIYAQLVLTALLVLRLPHHVWLGIIVLSELLLILHILALL